LLPRFPASSVPLFVGSCAVQMKLLFSVSSTLLELVLRARVTRRDVFNVLGGRLRSTAVCSYHRALFRLTSHCNNAA
jgi:hypothetical protein